MNGWDMMGWGWSGFWMVLAIILTAGLVYAGLRIGTTQKAPDRPDSAMAVLRRRYAAGEIDELEFNRRRAALDDWSQEAAQ